MNTDTGVDVPELVVDFGDDWVRLELGPDKSAWASSQAAATLGAGASARDVKRYAESLTGAAELAGRAGDAWSAFLLSPAPERSLVTVVRFVLVELESGQASDLVELLAPAQAPHAEPPEVTPVDTPAGLASRVVMRLVDVEDPRRQVTEYVSYGWTFAGRRWALVATTAFTDLVAAGRWRSACDELAAGVAIAAETPAT